MSPFVTLSIQSTFSLVAFALIALWHVAPRLNARSREDALVPLLWLQVFRYAPLALYAPGQVDPVFLPTSQRWSLSATSRRRWRRWWH